MPLRQLPRRSLLTLAALVLVTAAVAGIGIGSAPGAHNRLHRHPVRGQVIRAAGSIIPPDGKVYIGVESRPDDISAFDAAAGILTAPAIAGGYTGPDGPIVKTLASYAEAAPGSMPIVSWNVTVTGGQVTSGGAAELSYLKAQAAAAKAYGKPVFIRLDAEMNGSWETNYYEPARSAAVFVDSWRIIYTIFRSAGAANAAFVWCPNVTSSDGAPVSSWYPGDQYVDWACVDGYPQFGSPAAFGAGMRYIASFAARHGKPLMVGEWGPNSPTAYSDNATTADTIFGWAARYPDTVKALIYFNGHPSDFQPDSAKDFLLSDHPLVAAEFRMLTTGNRRYLYAARLGQCDRRRDFGGWRCAKD